MEVFEIAPLSHSDEWQEIIKFYEGMDFRTALLRLKKLSVNGVPQALFFIGLIYEQGGGGVSQSFEEAINWYSKSITECGEPKSYIALGRIYYMGSGVRKNETAACNFFKKAAERGERGALYALGKFYRLGIGVEKNLDRAEEYSRAAYRKGHVLALRELAVISFKKGKLITGISQYFTAYKLIYKLVLNDPEDPRIKIF